MSRDGGATPRTRAGSVPPTTNPEPEARTAGLAAFYARGEERRRQLQTSAQSGEPEDWFDPRPDAGMLLEAGHNPVDRALLRHREGPSRSNFRWGLRLLCERLQGVAPRSLSHEDVRRFAWHQITLLQVADYADFARGHSRSQSGVNFNMYCLRAMIRECHSAQLISTSRRDRFLELLPTRAPGRSNRGRWLADQELVDLVDACARFPTSLAARARSVAVILLLWTTGFRLSEVRALQLEDWDPEERTVFLPWTKNGDSHMMTLHPLAQAAIVSWVSFRGTGPGALFCSLNHNDNRAVSNFALRHMIQTRAEFAGLRWLQPHDFRRTFASNMMREHDAVLVSKLLNHRKLESTLIYDRSGDDLKRAAVDSMRLPPIDISHLVPTPPAGNVSAPHESDE